MDADNYQLTQINLKAAFSPRTTRKTRKKALHQLSNSPIRLYHGVVCFNDLVHVFREFRGQLPFLEQGLTSKAHTSRKSGQFRFDPRELNFSG